MENILSAIAGWFADIPYLRTLFLVLLCLFTTIVSEMIADRDKIKPKICTTVRVCFISIIASTVLVFIFCRTAYNKAIAGQAFFKMIEPVLTRNFLDIISPIVVAGIISCVTFVIRLKGLSVKKSENVPILKILTVVILVLSIVLSNFMLLADNISANRVTPYPLPSELLLKMVESDLNYRGLILDSAYFTKIDSSQYMKPTPVENVSSSSESETGSSPSKDMPNQSEHEKTTIPPPKTAQDYLDGITSSQYADGLERMDYFENAYKMYRNGKYNNFNTALFLHYLAQEWETYGVLAMDKFDSHFDSQEECYRAAIKAYQKNGSPTAHGKMALIFGELGELSSARENFKEAITDEDKTYVNDFSKFILKTYDKNGTDEEMNDL